MRSCIYLWLCTINNCGMMWSFFPQAVISLTQFIVSTLNSFNFMTVTGFKSSYPNYMEIGFGLFAYAGHIDTSALNITR